MNARMLQSTPRIKRISIAALLVATGQSLVPATIDKALAGSAFPFGAKLTLTSGLVPGTESNSPTLTVHRTGYVSAGLYCNSIQGSSEVINTTVAFTFNFRTLKACSEGLMNADFDLERSLTGLFKWRRAGKFLTLEASRRFHFRID